MDHQRPLFRHLDELDALERARTAPELRIRRRRRDRLVALAATLAHPALR